jgi:hypothetical protein
MGFKATKGIWKEHTLLTYLRCLQTLPSKQKRACAGTHASSASAEPVSVKALLSIPAIRALTISGFALTFLSLAFDVVFTLFCYTPVDAGGLGLEVSVDYRSIRVRGRNYAHPNSPRRSEMCSRSQERSPSCSGSSPCRISCGVSTTQRRTMRACTSGPSLLGSFHSSTSSLAPIHLPVPMPYPYPHQAQHPRSYGQAFSPCSPSPKSGPSHTASACSLSSGTHPHPRHSVGVTGWCSLPCASGVQWGLSW